MATSMSDREMRLRRREQQKEEEEKRIKEQIEREMVIKEMTLLRLQREQVRAERQRERSVEHTRTADLEGSYIRRERIDYDDGDYDNSIYSVLDEIGFDENQISHNSTGLYEEGINRNFDMGDDSRQLSFEAEQLCRELTDLTPIGNEQTQKKGVGLYRKEQNELKPIGDRERTKSKSHNDIEYIKDKRRTFMEEEVSFLQDDQESVQRCHMNSIEQGRLNRDGQRKGYRKVAYKDDRCDVSDDEMTRMKITSRSLGLREMDEQSIRDDKKVKLETEMRQTMQGEESWLSYNTIRQLKQKEKELDKLYKKQEEAQRQIAMKQKEHDNDMKFEKERLRREVEIYKRQLTEEKLRSEAEMQHRQKVLEERLKVEIEAKVRKEMEDRSLREMKYTTETEVHMLKEKEEKRKKDERYKLVKLRKEKLRKEEIDMMKKIENLKSIEKGINKENDKSSESDTEASEDEEDRVMREKLDKLKIEMEGIEARIKKKRKVHINEMKTEEEKTYTEKQIGKPKLPQFDGSQFEEWKLEVTSLIASGLYQEYLLAQTVRNSITSKARKVLQTLKPTANTKEIMKKMEDIYGNIRSGDSIIHDFYSAKQSEIESCSEWGIRIETTFNQALERGEIEESRKDKKLKERFWRGLYSEKLKMATRSSYESIDTFDALRRKARIEEMEMKIENTVKPDKDRNISEKAAITEALKLCQPLQKADENKAKMDQLLNKMEELEREVREVKRNQESENLERRRYDTYEDTSGYRPFRGGYRYRGRFNNRNGYRGNNRGNRFDGRNKDQVPDNKEKEENQDTKQSTEQKQTKEEKQDLN